MNNYINKKFGKLTIISLDHTINYKYKDGKFRATKYFKCKCDCGNYCIVSASSLSSGNVKSCGCLAKERFLEYKKYPKRLIRIYHNIKQRCFNKSQKQYFDYGLRGITLCDEWANNIFSFCEWAINNGYSDNLSIDRIDNNGNYEPTNCRWTDSYTQNQNKRNCNNITYKGQTHCLSEWSRILKQQRKLIAYYLKKGLSFEDFLKLKNITI